MRVSKQGKVDFDADLSRYRMAVTARRLKAPLTYCTERLLVKGFAAGTCDSQVLWLTCQIHNDPQHRRAAAARVRGYHRISGRDGLRRFHSAEAGIELQSFRGRNEERRIERLRGLQFNQLRLELAMRLKVASHFPRKRIFSKSAKGAIAAAIVRSATTEGIGFYGLNQDPTGLVKAKSVLPFVRLRHSYGARYVRVAGCRVLD